jgi:hypothetical protein
MAIVLSGCGVAIPSGRGGHRPGGAGDRIELQTVPLPSSVTSVRFPWYTPDGGAILFSGTPSGDSRSEIMSVDEDGSGLRCLTCGVAPEVTERLLKPIAFGDGRRVLVRVGDQSPQRAADHAVLECHPDVRHCGQAELVPIVVPPDGTAVVVQDQRELRPAPDGAHVGFSQVRQAADGESVMAAIVARLVRAPHSYELRNPRVVSTKGELKGFTSNGRAVLVAAFAPTPYEAANPDTSRIDLTTGGEERVTYYPDYDEPVEMSPDDRWYTVGSGRTSGLFETVAQVRRPSFIGPGIEPLTGYLFVDRRDQLLRPWLVRTGSEAHGATGQDLDPDGRRDGWHGEVLANWRADGTRIVFPEARTTQDGTREVRLVVAHLVDRRPLRARPVAPRSPEPRWAPSLEGFVPPATAIPPSRAGRRGGSVTIVEHSSADHPGFTVLEVTYHRFCDDGQWVIDGTEQADYRGGASGRSDYTADLTVSGSHHGYLRAGATISPGGITGTIESEVDGHHLRLP